MAAPELDVTAGLTGAVSQSDERLRAVIKIALNRLQEQEAVRMEAFTESGSYIRYLTYGTCDFFSPSPSRLNLSLKLHPKRKSLFFSRSHRRSA